MILSPLRPATVGHLKLARARRIDGDQSDGPTKAALPGGPWPMRSETKPWGHQLLRIVIIIIVVIIIVIERNNCTSNSTSNSFPEDKDQSGHLSFRG